MVLTDKLKVGDLYPGVVDKIEYLKAEDSELWILGLIDELIDIKYGMISPPDGWSQADLEKVLSVTCTQKMFFSSFHPSCSFLGALPFYALNMELSIFII